MNVLTAAIVLVVVFAISSPQVSATNLIAFSILLILAAIAVVRFLAPDAYSKLIRRVTSGAVTPKTQLSLESKLATLFILAFIGWTLWNWLINCFQRQPR